MLGSCGTSGAVRLWSAESQRLLATLSPIHTGESIRHVQVLCTCTWLYMCTSCTLCTLYLKDLVSLVFVLQQD